MKIKKLILCFLLLLSVFGCSSKNIKTEIINGEEFIVYEDYKYPSTLGEPQLTLEELNSLSETTAVDKINTYVDYMFYTKDMNFASNMDKIRQTYVYIAYDYDEIGIVYNDKFTLMYIKTNNKYYPVDPRNYKSEWLRQYNLSVYSFDSLEEMCDTLQGRTPFKVFYEKLAEGIIDRSVDWDVVDDESDSLETIELTLSDILTKINSERRESFNYDIDTSIPSTSKQDALALSLEDASRIEYADSDLDYRYLAKNITKQEAKQDAKVYADMIRSSYGPYYLYDNSEWINALESSLNSIDALDKDDVSGLELANILLNSYSFVKDDHFRINGVSTIDYNGGIYYYYYCSEFYVYKDIRDYFIFKNDKKWYLTSINDDTDIEKYIKPTINEEGKLTYQIGTFMHDGDNTRLTLTLSRGGRENVYESLYTKSSTYKQEQKYYPTSQAQICDGYYVLGIQSFNTKSNKDLLAVKKYAEAGKYLNGASNFIIDSRGNGGGSGYPYILEFCENLTGKHFELKIDEVFRYSEITYKKISNGNNINNTIVNKTDGTYFENKNIFAYLMDKDVASSGERGIATIKQMDNVLLIGTNSRGCMIGSYMPYYLPNSKIIVVVGPSADDINGFSPDIEGLGWFPDIYVDGYLALDRTIKMFKYYGLEPEENVKNYECWGENNTNNE